MSSWWERRLEPARPALSPRFSTTAPRMRDHPNREEELAQARLRARMSPSADLHSPEMTYQGPPLTREYLAGEAVRTAKLARDLLTPYQEFVSANRAVQEGRPLAAAGWGALGLAGVVPVGRGVGATARGASNVADAARMVPSEPFRVTSPFPSREIDEILGRTPVQADIPVAYAPYLDSSTTQVKGPSTYFGSRANRVESQIYDSPTGPVNFSSPMDTTIRRPFEGSGVRFATRNPFETLGVNPRGRGANDLMSEYIGSVAAARSAGLPTTDIDALMHLASLGDRRAADILAGVARGTERPTFLNPAPSSGLDDIVLVHSRGQGPVRVDSSGTGRLYPGGDFRTNPNLTASGNAFVPWRSTLHFTQNSRVADAPFAGTWSGNQNYVLSRLNDVMEANPGSLGNLNPSDTYFTPPLGRPLLLPNVKNVEVPPAPSGFHRRRWNPETRYEDGTVFPGYYSSVANNAYEDSVNRILGQNVNEMGGEFLGVRAIDSTFPQRQRIDQYADEVGVPLQGHSRGTLPGDVEQFAMENAYQAGLGITDDIFDTSLRQSRPYRDFYGDPMAQIPRHESPEWYRRLLSQGWLTGGSPVRFNPLKNSRYNF